MKSSIVYNLNTGKIVKKCVTPDEESAKIQALGNEDVIFIDTDIEDKYVVVSENPKKVSVREENPAYLDANIIRSIPNPSIVTLYGQGEESIEVSDGEVFLEADIPGAYLIVVEPLDAKYKTKDFEVAL